MLNNPYLWRHRLNGSRQNLKRIFRQSRYRHHFGHRELCCLRSLPSQNLKPHLQRFHQEFLSPQIHSSPSPMRYFRFLAHHFRQMSSNPDLQLCHYCYCRACLNQAYHVRQIRASLILRQIIHGYSDLQLCHYRYCQARLNLANHVQRIRASVIPRQLH